MYGTVRSGGAFGLVVMAASQGGLAAYRHVLAGLPQEFPAAVVVLQHRVTQAPDWLPSLLARHTSLPTCLAGAGEHPQPGKVYVAPTDRQLLVDTDGSFTLGELEGRLAVADPLLHSAAAAYGAGVIAVVLSGRRGDGAAGARAVKRAGGRVLVQDQATAECFGMPSAAMATGCVDFVLPLAVIVPALVSLVMAPGAAAWLRVPVAPWAPPASPASAAASQLVS